MTHRRKLKLPRAAQDDINSVIGKTFLNDGPAKEAMDEVTARYGVCFGDIIPPKFKILDEVQS